MNPDLRAAYETDQRRRYLVARTQDSWETGIEEQTIDEATRTLYAQYFDALYRAVALLDLRGVPLLAGSDAPNLLVYPGSALHDELEFLVKAGLSPGPLRCAPLLCRQCACAKSPSATPLTEQWHTRSYPPAWASPTIPIVPPEATIDPTGTK